MVKLGCYVMHPSRGLGIVIQVKGLRALVCWVEGLPTDQSISEASLTMLRPVQIVCKRFGALRGPNRLPSLKTPLRVDYRALAPFAGVAAVYAAFMVSIMIPWFC